ncbi:MAG: ATP phosphoribosyltransferase [Oscillospiraceae bacterium]|jgi:ATP phosphoribosyltransferase|nr:ATP phosphoribosyltransferase [Oscillospiraceae bacterium]
MLSVALPKGRLGNKVYKLLEAAGYACPELLEDSRKLIFTSEENGVKYALVKPSDVAIYVEYGAADIGVVGKDILLESGADVYELLDLGFGKCDLCVAAKNGFGEDRTRALRVATKFPHVAEAYYRAKNREIETIKLFGSIELAPILGLSDVIVDIVETGKTLIENDLSVRETIAPVSARLIANKSACKFKDAEIERIVREMEKAI